ncbi:mechanosensitive ion channel protein MscS [Nostoc sp. CENA543]|nr:mechanosensitive ion channel family protein [Nostoc sp. CENA543]AUT04469.1 mechanosensitive ion channel protein MscS [Nostoc sp. CENA543]
MVVSVACVPKATAQIPLLPQLSVSGSVSNENSDRTVADWVYLDGRRLFQISASKSDFSARSQNIQQNLAGISRTFFQSQDQQVKVDTRTINGLPVIEVNGQYLMTVTTADAALQQVDPSTLANQIAQDLKAGLEQAKQERQPQFLINQGKIAAGLGLAMLVASWGVYSWQQRTKKYRVISVPRTSPDTQNITTQLNQQQHQHLQEVKKRLFQIAQAGIWSGGGFVMLGLFPYTRILQVGIVTAAQIPLKIGMVLLGTYVVTRLSYALIDRLTTVLVSSGALLNSETTERLQLRVSTFSGVTKSIVTIIWVGFGILTALILFGIDVIPLLAGASLVGVAVSLASQNLIKDAINGFLIIIEDQYALGDVIAVGDVGGLVENLNLRMTQVRDAEGRLITIPNSEIKVVANLSSRWSRADLVIPVGYQTDIDQALQLIKNVALEMNQDILWKRQILETPQVLGIDNFGDRGLMIRVWIKTQPLKQWDVAREYRRRLKIAFDQAGVHIPVPQQAIWVNDSQFSNSHEIQVIGDGKSKS